MKSTTLTLGAALVLALSGCSQFEALRGNEPVDAIAPDPGFVIPDAFVAQLTAGDRALSQGWAALYGPEVESLVLRALANNPDLAASVEAVEQAQALLAQSRAALLPVIGTSFSVNEAEPLETQSGAGGFNFANPGAFDSYSAGVSVNWDTDLRGLNRAGVRASQAQLEASRAILETSRRNVAAATVLAYFDTVTAARQRELAERNLDAIEETAGLVDRLFEFGVIAGRDVALAQADLASARDGLVVARQGERAARRALETLLGDYPGGTIATAGQLPARVALPGETTPLEVLRRRPDVIAAEFEIVSRSADAQAARAARWPSLTLSTGFSTGGQSIDVLSDPASMALTLGLQLAQTLFDGGLRGARIDAADAATRQALARYGSTALTALAEVEALRDQIGVLDERQDLLDQVLANTQEALDLTQRRYEAGDTDLLDVLTLRQRVVAAEQAVVLNEASRLQAQVQFFQALGGPIL